MKRLEVLPQGSLHVMTNEGTRYIDDPASLDESTREKFFMLSATDVGTRIEHVGSRVTETVFLIFDNGDNPSDCAFELQMLFFNSRIATFKKTRPEGLRFYYGKM